MSLSEAVGYIYFILENNWPNLDFRPLKPIFRERGFLINKDFIKNLKNLKRIYEKVRLIYNDDLAMQQFIKTLVNFIVNDQIPSLAILPPIFEDFYHSSIKITDNLVKLIDRKKIILNSIKILPDLARIIIKYDYYFRGKLDFILKSNEIRAIDIINLPDGNIASRSYTKIGIWDLDTQDSQIILNENKNFISQVKPLSDGRIVVLYDIGIIDIWNLQNPEEPQSTLSKTNNELLLILPNDNIISSVNLGDNKYAINIWDSYTGEKILTLPEYTYKITHFLLLPENRLASSNENGLIRIWNLNTGELKQTLKGYEPHILNMNLLPDGRLVSVSGDDRPINKDTLIIWNKTGIPDHILKVDRGPLIIVNNKIIIGSVDGTITIWNSDTGTIETTLKGDEGHINVMKLLPDNRLIIASLETLQSHRNSKLHIWDLDTKRIDKVLTSNYGFINDILIHPDGKIITNTQHGIVVWK